MAVAIAVCAPARAGATPPIELWSEAGVAWYVVGTDPHGFAAVAGAVQLFEHRMEIAAGGRMAFGQLAPNPAVSGFVRGALAAWAPPWNPAVGLQLELQPGVRPAASGDVIPGSFPDAYNAGNRDDFVWGSLLVEPLRFRWGGFVLALPSLRLGTPLSGESGQRLLVAVSALRIGYEVSP